MELKLIREPNAAATPGKLYINGVVSCYTLEDIDRNLRKDMSLDEIRKIKQHSNTAIPTGTYTVVISYSNRFQRQLPILTGVPGFDGIRIHPGNTTADTEGCILLGDGRSGNTITNSRVAFDRVFKQLTEAAKKEKITIVIL
nr:DUF5675 family protein [uncultured Arsenicibacter sp.]